MVRREHKAEAVLEKRRCRPIAAFTLQSIDLILK